MKKLTCLALCLTFILSALCIVPVSSAEAKADGTV